MFKNKLLSSKGIGEKNGLVELVPGMENGVGNQTIYLTYNTTHEAKTAFNKLNNLKFDKNHQMSCVWVNDLRNIIEEEEEQSAGVEFKPPVFSISKDKLAHNLDEQLRNQFVFREDKLVYL